MYAAAHATQVAGNAAHTFENPSSFSSAYLSMNRCTASTSGVQQSVHYE